MKRKILLFTIITVALQLIAGCSKNWLDERSDKSIVVPSTLEDLSALLDYTDVANGGYFTGVMPVLSEVGSDAYYLKDDTWNTLSMISDKNAYIWNKVIFEGTKSNDWNYSYRKIYYANTVLEALGKIQVNNTNETEYNNVKGRALFLRGEAFFHLAQVFMAPYDEAHLDQLGLPLRLSADFNMPTTRSSMKATYDQIFKDLTECYNLLPTMPKYVTRASKPAVDGLLARIYLTMGKYKEAEKHAKACLLVKGDLMDYNDLDLAANLPFERFNKEVIYEASLAPSTALNSHFMVDELLELYEQNDLRRDLYYRKLADGYKFKGSYSRSNTKYFSGIAVDEIYLIYAECLARLGKMDEASAELNKLMQSRYRKVSQVSTYQPKQYGTAQEVLADILMERRKELVFRGLRWMDLRRLNKMGAGIAFSRNVKGVNYTLTPNSLRYVYPIPDEVIIATGIPQNER